jgi:hypothetical protein
VDLVIFLKWFLTLAVAAAAMAGWMTHRVYSEVRRQRRAALRVEERLAAYRHAVRSAGESS